MDFMRKLPWLLREEYVVDVNNTGVSVGSQEADLLESGNHVRLLLRENGLAGEPVFCQK